MHKLVIIGTGGHGREMARLAEKMKAAGAPLDPVGFLDDNPALRGRLISGLPVMAGTEWDRVAADEYRFVCALGNPGIRRKVAEKMTARGAKWATLIDPEASLGPDAEIAEGSMVCAGVVTTINLKIGRHCIVNLGCSLSHDVEIGDYATLACGVRLSGNVKVGEGAEIGVGVNVIQGMEIGAWSIIGAGAAVVKPIPPHVTAVGIPAKVIKDNS